jgi:transposase
MAFPLTKAEWRQLQELAAQPPEAKVLARIQAFLWLDAGESLSQVAQRLHVSRQTIYHWLSQFRAQPDEVMGRRLSDSPRSGRPRTVQEVIDPVIDAVIGKSPRAWGYRATVWTAPLLRQYLAEEHDLPVSRQSVSLALKRLQIRWKRPRHELARQSRTWRQAKGGSNAGCGAAPARWS